MHNPAHVLENKHLLDLNLHADHLISVRRPDLIIIHKKKRTCKIVDFAVPADHRIKLEECEKKNKYVDLARELKKKLWNMQVTIVPIVIGAFGRVTKGLLKGLEDLEDGGRVETIQTTTLLRTARILRKLWRLEETCCHSNSSEILSANASVKHSNEIIIIIINKYLFLYIFNSMMLICDHRFHVVFIRQSSGRKSFSA